MNTHEVARLSSAFYFWVCIDSFVGDKRATSFEFRKFHVFFVCAFLFRFVAFLICTVAVILAVFLLFVFLLFVFAFTVGITLVLEFLFCWFLGFYLLDLF